MKNLIKESGIRDIKALRKRYPKAKIYFHQDLDGVTTAIAMKRYLENNGFDVVDYEVIQYGDKEFAIKKQDAEGDVMPVLVDFAHGKPMFVIHTDHHDRQAGAEDTKSTNFRGARSNVETISQIISPKELFPASDIKLISTVDSADFAKYKLTPEQVVNYLWRLDKEKSLQDNKFLLGFVINKLLLAFKNKPNFLEYLVANSEPSLLSILKSIKEKMADMGSPSPAQLQRNRDDYFKQMENYPEKKYEDGIIMQYGGGSMMKPGSYDRYTPFKNQPDADFLIMMWPMGLVQASCNPFKESRELKGVNLGEIAQEVLTKYEAQLKDRFVPLSTIKWISEDKATPESVGFTTKDLKALYGKALEAQGIEELEDEVTDIMNKPAAQLTEEEFQVLDKVAISAWDIIQANSGGHKCITNISGLNYFGRSKRKPQGPYRYDPDKEDAPFVKFAKMLGRDLFAKLKEKIAESKEDNG